MYTFLVILQSYHPKLYPNWMIPPHILALEHYWYIQRASKWGTYYA
jgi:hypothetical protein